MLSDVEEIAESKKAGCPAKAADSSVSSEVRIMLDIGRSLSCRYYRFWFRNVVLNSEPIFGKGMRRSTSQ